MTLLLILLDHQTYLVHKNELPAERLAAEIGRGDWSNVPWESQWINELPRQVIAQDGLVIVSVGRPGQTIAEDAPRPAPHPILCPPGGNPGLPDERPDPQGDRRPTQVGPAHPG